MSAPNNLQAANALKNGGLNQMLACVQHSQRGVEITTTGSLLLQNVYAEPWPNCSEADTSAGTIQALDFLTKTIEQRRERKRVEEVQKQGLTEVIPQPIFGPRFERLRQAYRLPYVEE